MRKLLFLCILQMNLSTNVFAHGDDKLGPNGGHINMPGAFHTELVPNLDGSFKVYLIDSNFKNPMTKNSSVELKYISGTKKIIFKCNASNEVSFLCQSEEVKGEVQQGNIEIKAIRANVKASVAKYHLPLTLKNKKRQDDSEHDMSKM